MKRIDPRRLICLGITAATVASLGCICSADETDEIPTEPEETVCSEEDTEIMEEEIVEETEDTDEMIPEEETFIEEEIIIEEESEETIDLLEDTESLEVLAANGWMEECGDWYYYENGEPVTGWKKIKDNWYFFNSLGVMYTGIMLDGKDTYFLDENGRMKTGWVKYEYGWYYFGSDGKAAKGWTSIKNKWYYFNDSGVMYTGWLYLGDDRYLLDENGVMQTGWYSYSGYVGWSYRATWIYFESSGKAATGWKTIDGKRYYFDDNGYMANYFGYKIGDDYYCFDKNGNILTGWQSILYVSGSEKTTYWMYCKSDGKAAEGWQQINGKWYYFSLKTSQYSYVYPNYPYMFTGELGFRNDDETWDHYIFGENGAMLTGWQQGEYGRNYYLSNGKRADGWTKINGKWYFFEDYLYYAYMMSDQVLENNGNSYYFNSNGVMQTGWIKKNNYYMYATSGGVLCKEQWKKIDGYWYYFDSDCHMVTGIYRLKNKVYQFDSNGRCLNP